MPSTRPERVFTLQRTVELDVTEGDDAFTLRVELFQDPSDQTRFRVHIWRTEFYRIQSTFPQDPETGGPAHKASDEVLLIDWSTNLAGDYSHFKAENVEAAIDAVLSDVRRTLNRATGL